MEPVNIVRTKNVNSSWKSCRIVGPMVIASIEASIFANYHVSDIHSTTKS